VIHTRLPSAGGTVTYRVGHMCCGVGAGAKGASAARARVGRYTARFECAGGIDIDEKGLVNFEKLTGVRGTLLDLFGADDYAAFHGKEPPQDWREATPADVRAAYGDRPVDILFASFPCKGFSGLLSQKNSETPKYEALNRLAIRGLWLFLEAFKDDPARILLFENVPRIATRGRYVLDKIKALVRAYGFMWVDTEHDCGVIGGLGQSRRRYLGVARRVESVPNFIYEPEKKRLRGVGEIIGRLPLPGDPVAGIMHRVPMLQWKTWVRLALVPAGRDWRALNELAVVDGVLRDFGIMPEHGLRDNALGVNAWGDVGPTVTSARAPGQGRFSVADPRPVEQWQSDVLGVRTWREPTGTVPGRSGATNGAHSVADPRYVARDRASTLGVREWSEPTGTVRGESHPTNGAFSVADPRPTQTNQSYAQYGVKPWQGEPASTVSGQSSPGGGAHSIADPRILNRTPFNNVFRIVPFDSASPAVAGPGGAGGMVVADPRPAESAYSSRKYRVTPYDESSRTVIGASTTGDGAFAVADPRGGDDPNKLHGKHRVEDWSGPSRAVIAGRENGASAVADPRPTHGPNAHTNKMRVVGMEETSRAVTGSDRVGSGALSVADPRSGMDPNRPGYTTQAHYGVQEWTSSSLAVSGHATHDNGRWTVADPRVGQFEGAGPQSLPLPAERLVARIVALDETWHRPFTTLELAALQSIVDPDEAFGIDQEGRWFCRFNFELVGGSDADKREWIGNAVPSDSAEAMFGVMGETLLRADLGETFTLDSRAIWADPYKRALMIDPRQDFFGEAA
jgi:site-specific DNA-cytosine methylase